MDKCALVAIALVLAACSAGPNRTAAIPEPSASDPVNGISPATPPSSGPQSVNVVNTAGAPVITRALVPSTDSVGVSGTVTAVQQTGGNYSVTQGGPFSVTVGGPLPAISIDPAANTVRRPATVLVARDTRTVDGLTFASYGPYDVSAFSKIRVMYYVNGCTGYTLMMSLRDPVNGTTVPFDQLATPAGANNQGTRSYDVPGAQIGFFVAGSCGCGSCSIPSDVTLLIFGSAS